MRGVGGADQAGFLRRWGRWGGAGFTNKRGKGRVINLSIYLLENAHKAQVELLCEGKGLWREVSLFLVSLLDWLV